MQIVEDNRRTGKEFWTERSYYNIPAPQPKIGHQYLFDDYLPRVNGRLARTLAPPPLPRPAGFFVAAAPVYDRLAAPL